MLVLGLNGQILATETPDPACAHKIGLSTLQPAHTRLHGNGDGKDSWSPRVRCDSRMTAASQTVPGAKSAGHDSHEARVSRCLPVPAHARAGGFGPPRKGGIAVRGTRGNHNRAIANWHFVLSTPILSSIDFASRAGEYGKRILVLLTRWPEERASFSAAMRWHFVWCAPAPVSVAG
ncbi:hypothetical protein VTI28DRAFT_7587 [Corynascus sepedonium]